MSVEAAAPQQVPFFLFLLSPGGLPLVALGIVFSIWGIINMLRTRNPNWILGQGLVSLLPGVIAMIGIYSAGQRFGEMASSHTAAKPAEFAAAAGTAISYGFFGIASTIVPVALALSALHRSCRKNRTDPAVNE